MRRSVRWLLIGGEMALVLVAWGIGWLLGRPVFAELDWNVAAVWWGVLAAVPPLGFVWSARRFNLATTRGLMRLVDNLMESTFRHWSVVELIAVSLAAGFGEELLFRALIQGGISARWGIYIGLGLASIIFGLVHFLSAAYAFYVTVMGVYLGCLWIASDNLLVPIATHAVYDFGVLVWVENLVPNKSRTAEELSRPPDAN